MLLGRTLLSRNFGTQHDHPQIEKLPQNRSPITEHYTLHFAVNNQRNVAADAVLTLPRPEHMSFVSEEISAYCEALSKPQSAVLKELERETHVRMLYPQMLSGHLQGKFLSMISALVQPKAILEIGTFTGYSAICLASGLTDNGVLHTIEAEEELEQTILKFFKKAGVDGKIKLHIGQAAEIIPTLNMQFDLVFIDADKESYPTYYDLVIDQVRKGGLIIADNALWSGKVLTRERDNETQGIHGFNEKVLYDARVENVLLPLRDGVMLARKLV